MADKEMEGPEIAAWWLGRVAYADAWGLQHRAVAARAAGAIGDHLLLLEHDPVLTLGRRATRAHVRATSQELADRGIELVAVERGGDVTYHGPGQLTAYPIVGLRGRGLGVRAYVGALERALARTCAVLGVTAGPRESLPGCWCGDRKIGAIGIRVERGVAYHGIALNVSARLADFGLIDACGMAEVESTSIVRELGRQDEPSTESVASAAWAFARALASELEARLAAHADADPEAARRTLDALLGSAEPARLAVAAV